MFRLLRLAIKNYQYAVMGYSLFKAANRINDISLACKNFNIKELLSFSILPVYLLTDQRQQVKMMQ